MQRRRAWLAAALIAGLVIAAALCFKRPSEPKFKGRTITEWLELEQYWESMRPGESELDKAVRAMGTNALPSLMANLQRKETLWWNVYPRLPASLQKRLPYPKPADLYRGRAIFLLWPLGEEASPAVPILLQMATNHHAFAIMGLGRIGLPASNAIPILNGLATNGSVIERQFAKDALQRIEGKLPSNPESK